MQPQNITFPDRTNYVEDIFIRHKHLSVIPFAENINLHFMWSSI